MDLKLNFLALKFACFFVVLFLFFFFFKLLLKMDRIKVFGLIVLTLHEVHR